MEVAVGFDIAPAVPTPSSPRHVTENSLTITDVGSKHPLSDSSEWDAEGEEEGEVEGEAEGGGGGSGQSVASSRSLNSKRFFDEEPHTSVRPLIFVGTLFLRYPLSVFTCDLHGVKAAAQGRGPATSYILPPYPTSSCLGSSLLSSTPCNSLLLIAFDVIFFSP